LCFLRNNKQHTLFYKLIELIRCFA